jgi:DNA polymerase, archaea type
VYRTMKGEGGVIAESDDGVDVDDGGADRRDYDSEHYVCVLRDTFAARLARALTPDGFAAVVADPEQPSLFAPSLATMRTVLTTTSRADSD